MTSTFADMDFLSLFILSGVFTTGLLLISALFMKKSGGLFFSRTISQYEEDQKNPKFENERQLGKRVTTFIMKYVPPIFIAFLILLVLKTICY